MMSNNRKHNYRVSKIQFTRTSKFKTWALEFACKSQSLLSCSKLSTRPVDYPKSCAESFVFKDECYFIWKFWDGVGSSLPAVGIPIGSLLIQLGLRLFIKTNQCLSQTKCAMSRNRQREAVVASSKRYSMGSLKNWLAKFIFNLIRLPFFIKIFVSTRSWCNSLQIVVLLVNTI